MSLLGLNPQALGKCSRCLLPRISTLPGRNSVVNLRQPLRQATTAAKPRPKKTVKLNDDVAAVTKKTLSTRSSGTTVAKSTKKNKIEVPPAETPATTAKTAAKFTRAALTSTSAAARGKSKTDIPVAVPRPAQPPAVSRPKQSIKAAWPVGQTAAAPAALNAAGEPAATPKPVDTSSPEYKQAARKYTLFIVAIPILLVTSYFLFERLAHDIAAKKIPAVTAPSAPETQTSES
ncbi:hypothetical protein B0H66DRAFT_608184 [Apodospora peruviana]|uniref:Uncharacterized protein n=1 Tax=Apodospora peruviana TaxID=516989 RepID=A0AAE0HWB2_9PEZI|nr:hypothetical protein B0H66DRAFT_608184 [Apodospora peruviana]